MFSVIEDCLSFSLFHFPKQLLIGSSFYTGFTRLCKGLADMFAPNPSFDSPLRSPYSLKV
ncbi:hypothetical protein MUK42_11976 [Musa troglodytarum]|uniref:Uncharacterized protein n=1 Tax=Musa troglodytarum TaxID=320322 RepID=A0A9E7GKK0_9LILI|nr:hypothetical protein MUK42_11976 [Musa troglodytarum]